MSETPRTDAVEYTCKSLGGKYLSSSCMTALSFARQLEREVADLLAKLEHVEELSIRYGADRALVAAIHALKGKP